MLCIVSCPESLTGCCSTSRVLPYIYGMSVWPACMATARVTAAYELPPSEQQAGAPLLQAAPYVVLSDVAGAQQAGDTAEARTSAAKGAAPCQSQLPAPQQDQQSGGGEDDHEPAPSGSSRLPSLQRCSSRGKQQQTTSGSRGGQGQPPEDVAALEVLSTRVLVPAAQPGQQAQLISFRQYLRSGAQQQVS